MTLIINSYALKKQKKMFKDYRRLTDSVFERHYIYDCSFALAQFVVLGFLIVENSVSVAPYKNQCLDSIF